MKLDLLSKRTYKVYINLLVMVKKKVNIKVEVYHLFSN